MQNIFLDGNSGKLFFEEFFSELPVFCFSVHFSGNFYRKKLWRKIGHSTNNAIMCLAKKNKEENKIMF